MPPAIIAAGVAAGGAIYGASKTAGAAKDASDAQTQAANRANQLQWDIYQGQRSDQQSWRQAGLNALYGTGGIFRRKDGGTGLALSDLSKKKEQYITSRIAQEKQNAMAGKSEGDLNMLRGALGQNFEALDGQLRSKFEQDWANSPESQAQIDDSQYELDPELTRNFTNEDFVKDPGYDFRMQEGQKALERSAAARGGLQSGGTLKALAQYGQNYASNEYQNAYNRFNADRDRRFNRLSSIAGLGQTANSALGQAGQNFAGQVGSNMMGAANAQGAAGIAGSNAWGSAINNLGNLGMQAAWMSKTSDALKQNKLATTPTLSGMSYLNTSGMA